jgi:hypothetical protein
MNYREKQLRQQNKNTIAKLTTAWDLEKQNLQQDIVNLQNSTDVKVLEQTKKQLEEKTDLLDKIIAMLGNEDIKNTSNLTNLLQGKTLKEVITANSLYQQKIKDQDTALINLAKQKIKGKKATEKLLNELETNWTNKEKNWEKEKEKHVQSLAQSREIIANLEKEKKGLNQLISTDKLELVKENQELKEYRELAKSSAQKIEKVINSGLVLFLVAMFMNYNLRLKDKSVELTKRTEQLEKKNGHEQEQINQLKEEIKELKKNQGKT